MSTLGVLAKSMLALAASAAVVAAQQPERKGLEGPQQQERPGSAEPRGQQPDRPGRPDSGDRQSAPREPAAKDRQAEPKQPPSKDRQAEPKQPAAKEKQAEPKQPAVKDRQAEPRQPAVKDRQSEPRQPASKDRQADRPPVYREKQAQPQITDEQRTRIRQSLGTTSSSARVTNVKFNVVIGTRVPRNVRFYPLPTAIVEIVPEYRGYEYIIVEDRITIVEPRSRMIVAVIDDENQRRRSGQQVALQLSAEQRRFIRANVDLERHRADVNIRLALGAEVPERVEIYAFPDPVMRRIPKIREYRFVVVDNDIIVVDPRDREVALVISR